MSKHSLPEGWEQLELGFAPRKFPVAAQPDPVLQSELAGHTHALYAGPPRTTWPPGWYRSEDSGEVIHVATWGGRRAVYRGMLGTSWAPSEKQTVWAPFAEPEPE